MSKVVIQRYLCTGPSADKPSIQFWVTDGTSFMGSHSIDISGTDFDNTNFRGVVVTAVLAYVNDPGGLNLGLSEADIYNLPPTS